MVVDQVEGRILVRQRGLRIVGYGPYVGEMVRDPFDCFCVDVASVQRHGRGQLVQPPEDPTTSTAEVEDRRLRRKRRVNERERPFDALKRAAPRRVEVIRSLGNPVTRHIRSRARERSRALRQDADLRRIGGSRRIVVRAAISACARRDETVYDGGSISRP